MASDPIQPSQDLGATRWILIVFGLVIVILGLLLWIFPAVHTKPAPDGAKCNMPSDCVVKVDDAPETLLTSLVVLGAVLALVGVNNRRIAKFTGPGDIGFETVATVAAEKATQKTQEKAANLSDTKKAAATLLAQSEARANVFRQAALSGGALSSSDVEHIAESAAVTSISSVAGNPSFE